MLPKLPRFSQSDLKALLLLKSRGPLLISTLAKEIGDIRSIAYLKDLGLVKVISNELLGNRKVALLTPTGDKVASVIGELIGKMEESMNTSNEEDLEREYILLYKVSETKPDAIVLTPMELKVLLILEMNGGRLRVSELEKISGMKVPQRLIEYGLISIERRGPKSKGRPTFISATVHGVRLVSKLISTCMKILTVREIEVLEKDTYRIPADSTIYLLYAIGLREGLFGRPSR
ncbi:MAG: hypothetical protein DRJ49_07135 [Thermoprotei archaeon]|nr:MAG: hypothetical protein DRN53_04155 [Thermoprotei archaeon]RLE86927.1 MAG: hypothetical protein DRJ49_07135 [Thermoprotei archaeon]